MIVEGMAQQGAEPTYCMGDDIPLPVLSGRPHMMYDYFKQRFAQVTNPAIDPLREGLVMSLEMRLGHRGNLLVPGPDAYNQVGCYTQLVAGINLVYLPAVIGTPAHGNGKSSYFALGCWGGAPSSEKHLLLEAADFAASR